MGRSGWHRTKIVCTLGLTTDAPGVIERLIGDRMASTPLSLKDKAMLLNNCYP